VAVVILLLAGLSGALIVALRGHGPRPAAGGSGSRFAAAPDEQFVFPLTQVHGVPVVSNASQDRVRAVAAQVQTTLSAFYRAAFLDSRAWAGSMDRAAWDAFAPTTRDQATANATSLTLSSPGGHVQSLKVAESSLDIQVLLDPQGIPQAAMANVTFVADGTLVGGESMQVKNQAHFLMRPAPTMWLIFGYPGARTQVTAPEATPTPSGPTPAGAPSSGVTP